jgi:Nickel responsive protein SCO4226-like
MNASVGFVVECLWPSVSAADLEALDRSIEAATAELLRERRPIRYLGLLLVRDDEIVLCQFEGSAEDVRDAAERAGVPFERILETSRSSRSPASPK